MRILTASLLSVFLSAPAMAGQFSSEPATLQKSNGKVLANVGRGYAPALIGMTLKPGDSLMLGANGSALLYFTKSKCRVEIPAARVTLVTGPEMCGQALLPSLAPWQSGNVVVTPAKGGPAVDGEIPPQLIAGGVFVLGAAAAINSFNQNNNPISGP